MARTDAYTGLDDVLAVRRKLRFFASHSIQSRRTEQMTQYFGLTGRDEDGKWIDSDSWPGRPHNKPGQHRKRGRAALTSTAYHEAGHAIAALAIGMPFSHVEIVGDSASWGCMHHDPRDGERDVLESRSYRNLFVCLSGGVAQEYHGPGAEEEGGSGLGSDDWYAQALTRAILFRSTHLARWRFIIEQKSFVWDQIKATLWPGIRALARDLLVRDGVLYSDAHHLFRSTIKPTKLRAFELAIRAQELGIWNRQTKAKLSGARIARICKCATPEDELLYAKAVFGLMGYHVSQRSWRRACEGMLLSGLPRAV